MGLLGSISSSLRISLSHKDWGALTGKPSGFVGMDIYSPGQIVKFPHIELCCLQICTRDDMILTFFSHMHLLRNGKTDVIYS